MKSPNYFLFLQIAFGFFIFITNKTEAKTTTTSTKTERGAFAVNAMVGAAERRLLNTDGTFAPYKGTMASVGLDFKLFQTDSGEVRFFADYQQTPFESKLNTTDSILHSESIFGLRFHSGNVYLGLGTGTSTEKIKTSTQEISVANNHAHGHLGYEFTLSDSFSLAFQVNYSSNVIRVEAPLTNNGFSEGASLGIKLIWSQPLTIINTITSSKF